MAHSIEQLYPDQLEDYAARLAQHYSEADDAAKSFQYSMIAGDRAARVYANAEALAHYARALHLASQLKLDATQVAHLYQRRGRTLELSGRFEEALANYQTMQRAGEMRGDPPLTLAALMEQAKLYAVPSPLHNPPQARLFSEHASTLARELGDRAAEATILWTLMLSDMYGGGERQQALVYGEQSAALARELGRREQLAFTLNDLASAYGTSGQTARAFAALEESRSLWRELGNMPMLTDNLGNMVLACLTTGDYAQAIRFSEEGFGLSESIGNTWGQAHNRFMVGNVYLELGEYQRAIEIMESAIEFAEQSKNPAVLIGTRADLAFAYGNVGAVERGLELAQQASVAANQFPLLRPWAQAMLARLYLLQGDVARARRALTDSHAGLIQEGSLLSPVHVGLAEGEFALATHDYRRAVQTMDELLALLHKVNFQPWITDALYLKGQALLAQRESDHAQEILTAARTHAEALGSKRMLWQIYGALSALEAARGNLDAVEKLRAPAREIIQFIAAQLSDPTLRESFWQQPRVHAVMGAD